MTLQILLVIFAVKRFNRADKTKTCILNIEHEFEHGTRQRFSRRTPFACQSSLSATFPQPSVFPRSFDTSLHTHGEATLKSPPINIYAMLLTGRSLRFFSQSISFKNPVFPLALSALSLAGTQLTARIRIRKYFFSACLWFVTCAMRRILNDTCRLDSCFAMVLFDLVGL